MQSIKKPIKILFISHSSAMAGAERSLLLLLENIDRKYFTPVVVLPRSGPLKEEIRHLNIKIYKVKIPLWLKDRRNILLSFLKFGYSGILEVIALFMLYKIIKQEKIDMIYTNTTVIFSGAIIAFITKKLHIWHIREIIPENPYLHFFLPDRWIFNFILRSSNKIIANSKATAEQFQNDKLDGKIRIIYNAVDIEKFKIHHPFPYISGAKSTDWLIAVIGSLQKGKAQDDAIHAVEIAKKVIPNIKLLIVGEGAKEYKNYLEELVFKLNVSTNVIFMGYRDNIPQILSYCKVLLVPSCNESFGRVVIEAMAAGIPVIGSDIGGIKEIIKNELTGYLILPKSPIEIAMKMIYLYRHTNISKKMGSAGRKLVKEKFNVNNYTRNVEKAIQEVIM